MKDNRIQELAEQAGLLGPSSRVGKAHEATEKFAELIIAECAKACVFTEQEPVARCCQHDSDCAVHNMPAYPVEPCDCTQQVKFWSVTGKFERQAFANLSGAEAYCKGLNATHPEGGYIVRPLLETPAPKRPWVGLTAADMRDISLICIDKVDAMLMTEDKLEEKNYD